MGMKEIKTHAEKINRLKFFCKKHEDIVNAFGGIRSSIWTDHEKDTELFSCMNKVLMMIESKMLEQNPSIHLANLNIHFFGDCEYCTHVQPDVTLNFYDILGDPDEENECPKCASCEGFLEVKPDGEVI